MSAHMLSTAGLWKFDCAQNGAPSHLNAQILRLLEAIQQQTKAPGWDMPQILQRQRVASLRSGVKSRLDIAG